LGIRILLGFPDFNAELPLRNTWLPTGGFAGSKLRPEKKAEEESLSGLTTKPMGCPEISRL
jgi:hypothetical protein